MHGDIPDRMARESRHRIRERRGHKRPTAGHGGRPPLVHRLRVTPDALLELQDRDSTSRDGGRVIAALRSSGGGMWRVALTAWRLTSLRPLPNPAASGQPPAGRASARTPNTERRSATPRATSTAPPNAAGTAPKIVGIQSFSGR